MAACPSSPELDARQEELRRRLRSGETAVGETTGSLVVRQPPRKLAHFCPRMKKVAVGLAALRNDLGGPGLVLDVGAFDGTNAISYARAGHRVMSYRAVGWVSTVSVVNERGAQYAPRARARGRRDGVRPRASMPRPAKTSKAPTDPVAPQPGPPPRPAAASP